MKRIALLLAAVLLLLTGCDAFDGQYVRVTPHAISSAKTPAESEAVETYMELRNSLAQLVASGAESGVIPTRNYPEASLADDIAIAQRHICTYDPIGSYAVEDLTYEIGTKNGSLAVAVNISYLHSRSDIRNITRLASIDDLENVVMKALENLDNRKVILVPDYVPVDVNQMVQDLAKANPQIIMECPIVTNDIYGLGASRLMELTFTYENSTDSQRQMRSQVKTVLDSASLYVSGEGSDNQKYAQLDSFLMDRFRYKLETSITPAYSLLRHGVGDSRAFATVYAAMCRNAGLECMTVTGTRNAEPWTWNMICEDGVYYHVDLTQCKENGGFREKADADMKGYVWDYSAFPACGTAGEIPVSEE